ncbi:GtrA family protein, partial [candidate division KSB1 bacterium]|nr:GtrA family protein [candidate division KSB1 bacterium]
MNILNKIRFLKFALVGGSGVIVNNGLLWLLAEFTSLPFYLCSFIAIELSIITNFLLNDAWTWRDKREGRLLSRLYRYNASTAFSSLFINMTVLLFLKEWLGMPYLIANLIGIGCGVIFNFLANSVWTYGEFRFKYPRAVWIIFFCSLAFRLLLAAGLGAGFDEAYYYAYSLRPSLSYFDHPPVVGFLAGYFPSLTGIVSAFTIRLAAVLLYSITGLLLYQLARQFVDARKATWAMLLFNITPIFFLLAGIFILPDAGLVLFWILT